MKISPDEYDLLREVAAEFDYPKFDPKIHVTLGQLADQWGVSKNGARSRMKKRKDRYESLMVVTEGNKRELAYKKIE